MVPFGWMAHRMPDGTTDWDLVERIKAGDDQAFDLLMGRYKRPVLHFVYRMTHDVSVADDLAQDVFVRVYQNIRKPSFRRTPAAFSSWLFQVTRNATLDYLRWRKRHPSESLAVMDEHGEAIPARTRSAPEEAVAHETREAIAASVALLPEDQRTVLLLAEYEDLPHAEIADVLKCSVKSVEGRLFRARRFLRHRLSQFFHESLQPPAPQGIGK